MLHFHLKDQFLRLAGRATLLGALTLLAACSSSDKRPLVLVNVPVGDYPSAKSGVVDVTVPGVGTTEEIEDLSSGSSAAIANGHYGVYLPAGTSGSATVTVVVLDAANCQLASGGGASAVAVSPGETAGPVIVTLMPSAYSCIPDASPGPDTLPPPADVVSPTEAAGPDLAAGQDAGPPTPVDGSPVEAPRPDGVLPDVGPDSPIGPDGAGDVPVSDVALPTEVGIDGAYDLPSAIDLPVIDAETGPATMSVFRNCGAYTHSEIVGGTPGAFGVNQIIFTPDGKNLVSYGEDGRAKVWNVTDTGLVEPASKLVFTASGSLFGGISADGKYVALGDRNATVKIFDLPRSIAYGVSVLAWTLPHPTITSDPDAGAAYLMAADVVVFTKDLNHVVVGYYGGGAPDDNYVAVWELGSSPRVVQVVKLTAPERAWMGVPGSSPASALIGTIHRSSTDAGDDQADLAVLDVSPTGVVTRAEAVVPGYFNDMAFSPDGNGLAVGFDSGQALLYDLTDKTKIAPQSPPLIPASASGVIDVYGMAFSLDGKYFAAGLYDYNTANTSVRLLPVAQRQSLSVEKSTVDIVWAVAFAPNGLGLAIGEITDGVLLYCTP